jgi:hypothetical protein
MPPLEFDLDDVDPERIGGYDTPDAGRFQFLVQAVEENGGKDHDSVVVDAEVVGCPKGKENNLGKSLREYFQQKGKGAKRTLQFAVACGIVTIDDLKAHKAAGRPVIIPFPNAKGKALIMDVEKDTYQGKDRMKVNFGIFSIDSKEAEGVVLNQNYLNKDGGESGGDSAGGGDGDPFANMT